MRQFKNLLGQTINYWTVIAPGDRRWHGRTWLCECRCGVRRLIYGPSLTSKDPRRRSRSCGCYKVEAQRLRMRAMNDLLAAVENKH
jgi:hypothetical protein